MAKSAIQGTFSNILDTQIGDAEQPKTAPAGQYICRVGQHKRDKSTKKFTEYVEFLLHPLEAAEVDEDALEEWLTTKDGRKKLADQSFRATYYLTHEALYRLEKFLQACGLGDMSMKAAIPETLGKMLMVTIKHKPSDDGQRIFAVVDSVAPVKD